MSVLEADDLRAAWSKIDTPEKWGKGISRSSDGRHCMAGALSWTRSSLSVILILRNVLPVQFCGKIALANDAPATTHDDVRRWFAEAIARAEAQ